MDDVCGGRASSISLRLVEPPTRAQRKPIPSISMSSGKESSSVSEIAGDSLIVAPSSDSEDDVVMPEVSLKEKTSRPCIIERKRRRPKNDNAPSWFVEVHENMRKEETEWRNELRGRLDRQEQLQVERISVMKDTNELLKTLIGSHQHEI